MFREIISNNTVFFHMGPFFYLRACVGLAQLRPVSIINHMYKSKMCVHHVRETKLQNLHTATKMLHQSWNTFHYKIPIKLPKPPKNSHFS